MNNASASSPGAKATRADWVYAALREDLGAGAFDDGQPLLARDLRRRFACGVSPLREAMSRLVAEGFLAQSAHKGVAVPPLSLESLRELTRIRILLEGDALARALDRGDSEWEAQILAALHRLERAPRPGGAEGMRDWEARHRAFHLALLAAAESPRLMRMVGDLMDQTQRYRAMRMLDAGEGAVASEAADDHRRLAEVVVARDARATDLLGRHYARTCAAIAATFGAAEAG